MVRENEKASYDVLVIGAGLTGLALALFLKQQGKRVMVIEREARVGGQMRTIERHGFRFEAGPNTGVVGNDSVLRLFGLLGERCELMEADKGAEERLVLYKGKPQPLPKGFWGAIKTPLFTWKDKCRVLAEPFRAKGTDPFETVGELVRRRLGQSFFDYAVDPFISGIYAGDPDRLIARFALPKLYRLEHEYGSFIGGGLKRMKAIKAERARGISKRVFSVRGGFTALAEAMADAVGREDICLDAQDLRLECTNGLWKAHFEMAKAPHRLTAPRVISTIPAYGLPNLLPQVAATTWAPIVKLPYAPVVEVGVGLKDGSKIPRAFGLLVPSKEGEDVLGILHNSACYPDKAPEGGASLSVFMGGMRRPELVEQSDDEIRGIVSRALTKFYGYAEGIEPDELHIFRHRRAIPQYEADSADRLRAIGEVQMQCPGLILAGGICDGVGIADRIRQAERIAQSLS